MQKKKRIKGHGKERKREWCFKKGKGVERDRKKRDSRGVGDQEDAKKSKVFRAKRKADLKGTGECKKRGGILER